MEHGIRALDWGGLALLAAVWISTAPLQVPCHRKLACGLDSDIARRLVATNRIRTAGWTLRLLVALTLMGAPRPEPEPARTTDQPPAERLSHHSNVGASFASRF